MKASKKQRLGGAATGLAGLLALFSQGVSEGPTVDFKPVGDVYQADQSLRAEPQETMVDHREIRTTTPAKKGRIVMNRYVQRSQFDGRGGILDAYS
jgi:hypothetical protein